MALAHFTINFALTLKTNLGQVITRFQGWVKVLSGADEPSAEELAELEQLVQAQARAELEMLNNADGAGAGAPVARLCSARAVATL